MFQAFSHYSEKYHLSKTSKFVHKKMKEIYQQHTVSIYQLTSYVLLKKTDCYCI